MLTLARFVLDKTGGDSMPEVLDNLHRARARMAAPIAAPAAGDGSGGHAALSTSPGVRVAGARADRARCRRGRLGRGRLSADGPRARRAARLRQERRRPARRLASRRDVHRSRRHDRAGDRPIDPRAVRGRRRGGVPGTGARGDRGARPARPIAEAPSRDLTGRRCDRRPAQPLGTLSWPAAGLARRAHRGARPAPASLAQRPPAHPGRRPDEPHPATSLRPGSGSTGRPHG